MPDSRRFEQSKFYFCGRAHTAKKTEPKSSPAFIGVRAVLKHRLARLNCLFRESFQIKSLNLPASRTTIIPGVFAGNHDLISMTMPASVTETRLRRPIPAGKPKG